MDILQTIFTVMIVMSGFLMATRPDTTPASLIFRLSILLIGVVGLVTIWIMKRRNQG